MKLIGILIILIGFLNAVNPEISWTLQHFLSVKGGEPSDFSLIVSRITGVVMIAAGAYIMFM